MRKIREEVQSFAQSYTPHIVPAFSTWCGLLLSVCLLLPHLGQATIQPDFPEIGNGRGTTPGGAWNRRPPRKIQRVVVIFQENRTPTICFMVCVVRTSPTAA